MNNADPLGNMRLKSPPPGGRGKLSGREETFNYKTNKQKNFGSPAVLIRRAGLKYTIQNNNNLNQEISVRTSKFSHRRCCDNFWEIHLSRPYQLAGSRRDQAKRGGCWHSEEEGTLSCCPQGHSPCSWTGSYQPQANCAQFPHPTPSFLLACISHAHEAPLAPAASSILLTFKCRNPIWEGGLKEGKMARRRKV